jgi:hypothetical protein
MLLIVSPPMLSLAKMLSGANAFEISDIQEAETEGALTRRSGCNNVAFRCLNAE